MHHQRPSGLLGGSGDGSGAGGAACHNSIELHQLAALTRVREEALEDGEERRSIGRTPHHECRVLAVTEGASHVLQAKDEKGNRLDVELADRVRIALLDLFFAFVRVEEGHHGVLVEPRLSRRRHERGPV